MSSAPVAITDPTINFLDTRLFTEYALHGSKGPEAFGPRFSCLEFRGSGVIAGKFHTRDSEVSEALDRCETQSDLVTLMKSASGSFTILVFDRTDRSLYFLNDPLGGGFILRYTDGSFHGFSTDLTSLRQAIGWYGQHATRDYLYELSGIATGTQHNAGDTPFSEITVEDSGHGIQITADGNIHILDYQVDQYMYTDQHNASSGLIEAGVHAIQGNIAAVLEYNPSLIVSDITGGFDSRLVLAAITSLGACEAVTLRSIRTIVEWEFAEGLATTYGMQLTDAKAFGEVWGIKHDLYEDSVVAARKSGGLISNEMSANSLPYPLVKLQGGYGGTFRTIGGKYYPETMAVDTEQMARDRWKWAPLNSLRVGEERLFDATLANVLASRAARTIESGVERNVPNAHLPDYLYAKGRLRYWFGQQSYHSSRAIAQFDPLYNTHLTAAAYRTPFERRKANMVGLLAMQRLDPKLLEYPFYNSGVPSALFLEENPNIKSRPFKEGNYSYRRLDMSPQARVRRDFRRDEVTNEDSALASALSVKGEHLAGLRKWGVSGYSVIMSDSSIRSYFNSSALKRLLTARPASREDAQAAIRVLGTLFRSGLLRPDHRSTEDSFIFG